jgi:hypothetical protein
MRTTTRPHIVVYGSKLDWVRLGLERVQGRVIRVVN